MFGRVLKVSETAAGWDIVSEVDVASLLNVVQDEQTGVLVEFCCPIHAGLTRSSGLPLEALSSPFSPLMWIALV